ncbi:uncharacterized protein LOC128755050 [Synchiropus splendidus]|uniref:uncharacterized protein LOC128755050 n=1 Tax=Synchiropus splendidus TaxID=270530 RepID=UPI00237E9521|nr:uncharacterized protein LOC128755050 [Synchiropus splendidus]
MTRLSLLVLSLAALLGPGLAVDVGILNNVVDQLLNRFKPNFPNTNNAPTFTLAVKVPQGSQPGQYNVNQVPDTSDSVKNVILNSCDIYSSSSLVAATVLKPVDGHYCQTQPPVIGHSEYRVLQRFNLQAQGQELMVFYCSTSPCNGICTNDRNSYNILQLIKRINAWANRALVFTKIFKPPNRGPLTPAEMTTSLKNLGASIGLSNIYRCSGGQCQRCFNNDLAVRFCIADN